MHLNQVFEVNTLKLYDGTCYTNAPRGEARTLKRSTRTANTRQRTINAQIQHFRIEARRARAAPRAISIYTVCCFDLSAEAAPHKHSDRLQANRGAFSHAARTVLVRAGRVYRHTDANVRIC